MTKVGVLAWVLGIAMVGEVARAGQLFVEEFGVREVRDDGGTIVAGKVTSVAKRDKRHREVEVLVDRVWAGKDGVPTAVGATRRFTIFPGVEWTDPHKSPIERRLRGGRREAAIGDQVVVVPSNGLVELLAPTPEVLRRLDVLYAGNPAARITAESEDSLRSALEDPDLAELAAAELLRRGKLDTRALLGADRALLQAHYKKLSGQQLRHFLTEAIAIARDDERLRERLADVVLDQPTAEVLPQLQPLVALYRFDRKEDERRIEQIRLGLLTLAGQGSGDLSTYVDFLVGTLRYRPDYRDRDNGFEKMTARLDGAHKAELAVRLLQQCPQGSRKRKDELVDRGMLAEVITLAEQSPSPALLPILAQLDPSAAKANYEKQWLLEAVMAIAASVVKVHPKERDRARDLVEPMLEKGISVDERALDSWRAAVGAGRKQPPVPIGIELDPGKRKRLPSGWTFSFKKDGDDYSVEGGDGDTSESRRIDPKGEWYSEWWMPPYLVIVTRIGTSDRVRLQLRPMASEPPPADDATMTDQARPIADRRGCADFDRKDHDEFNGRFLYVSKDKKGRPCTLLIGVRTRKVIRMTP
jgi:hypothetical protein